MKCTQSFLAMALLCPLMAMAGPKEDLHAAFSKFMAARSFHASIIDAGKNQQVAQMDFVAPDRYRIQAAQGPQQTIIGDTAYMDIGGHVMKVPVPVSKMTARYRDPSMLKDMEKDMTVERVGSETLNGQPAVIYHYTATHPHKTDARVWVAKDSGMPIQVGTQDHGHNSMIRYSRFNDPTIKIAAPQ